MSDSYLDGKVREALLAAKGSRTLAQNTLIIWALKDDKLLRLMIRPFLKAISGDAIARAIKRGVTVPGLNNPPPKPAPSLTKEQLARVLSQVGSGDECDESLGGGLSVADILGGTGAKPGSTSRPAVPVKPIDQASSIRTLAAVYAKNRKKP